LSPHIIDELTGHAIRSETMGRYGKRYGVTVLKEAVEMIPSIKGN
jgi:ribosomal protein L37AE/L43A